MKLTVKTLQQKQLQFEVNEDDTVKSVKEKLKESENVDPARQMLIYQGKVLSDDSTLKSQNIKETDFLVMMATRTPAAKPSSPSAPAAAPAPAQVAAPTPSVPSASQPAASATSTLVTGTEYESAVNNLMEMGFEHSQVVRALKASFNNPDRAAEYLFSGNIPDTVTPPQQQGQGGSLDFLRNDPAFQQIRSALHRNPQSVPALLHSIGSANPRLLQLINEHQEEFIALLNDGPEGPIIGDVPEDQDQEEDLEEEEMTASEAEAALMETSSLQAAMAAQSGRQGQATGAPQVQYIQVTAAEREAIDRLVSLGFERSRVTEAFLACDKDETLAANYLFDHMNDEDF